MIGFWKCCWFWQVMYWHFSSGIYLFKVSTTTSDKGSYKNFFWFICLEYKQVNASWLVTIDLEKVLFSVSVYFKAEVTTYHARLTVIKHCTSYLDLILQLLNYLKRKRIFNIRMYFMLNLSSFVLSLDSSACLRSNILPDMYS